MTFRLSFWSLVLLFISPAAAHGTTSAPVNETSISAAHGTSTTTASTTATGKTTSIAASTTTPASGNSTTTTAKGPTTPAGKNPKRGLAFAAGDTPGDLINANQTRSVISWQYNWATSPPDYLTVSGIEYVPMQWGSGNIEQLANAVNAQGAKILLAFNEPDYVAESNMKPADAALLWMQYIEPLKAQGIRLGAPAVTAASTGQPWLVEFMAACSKCSIDFIPLHWYGSGVEGFYSYIGGVHNQFPTYPLWVTEYAETSTDDAVVADFLNQTISFMDTLDWIERYAWFGYFRPRDGAHYNLLDVDGGLNTLGKIYVGADTIHTQVAPTPTSGYKTVNGADDPSQQQVTAWPAPSGSASRRWDSVGMTWVLAATLFGGALGTFWII